MGSAGICVLGPLTVDGNSVGLAPRDRVVLAALAMHPGEVISAERLADALWGEQPPTTWRKVVPGCVMRLRRALGAEAIETVADGYRLVVPGDEVDARRFERLVGRAHELLTLGEPERAAHLSAEALALWRGRPLGDLDGWDAGQIEVARLEELRRDAEELHLDAALKAGRYREVLGEAQVRVAEAPLRERRWALLATAQYQAGRQGEALRTLHRARTVLATELGVDPGPELVALEQAVLRQDPSLVAHELGPEPAAVCPYPGLVAYEMGDTDGFFGRDADVAECLHRLATTGVVAVVGPSGSGKSSLVRAGVAAALVRDGHRVVIITPGAHPTEALAALHTPGPDLVLVVDQCEQALSVCRDADERSRFFAALTDRAERLPVVVAIRADRLGDATTQPGFARLVERGLHLLGPMAEADLRAAIEGPAHQAGLLLEPGLVDLLVREVEGEPGALPLLSHALRETWERREGRTLTVSGYQATGGIRGAISRTAEEVYERVPPDQRADLRDLLLRLVESSVDGDPVSTPVSRQSLVADSEHEHLVDLLVDARLITSDDGVIELSHESLARAWPRLRGWLDDDADGQRILRHLSGASEAWASMGRPDTELYRGTRLRTTLDWRERSHPSLTSTEREFLAAARRHADAAAKREQRTVRRLHVLVAAVAMLLVAAMLAALLAIRQADRAEVAAVTADARLAAGLARDVEDVEQALLLAVEGVRLQDSRVTEASLLAALTRSPALIGSYQHDSGIPPDPARRLVAVRPDGEVVIASDGEAGAVLGADTLDVVQTFETPPQSAVYQPGGEQLAVSTHTFNASGPYDVVFHGTPISLLNAATLEPAPAQLGGWPAGKIHAFDLDYSADGSRLAAQLCEMRDWWVWDFGCTATVWDVASPAQPALSIPVDRAWGVALNVDGSLLYVATYEAQGLEVFDVASGALVRSKTLTPDTWDILELSPDGTTVVIRDRNDIVLLDASALTERARMPGHTARVRSVAFSHDGTRLASGDADGTVIVWDIATGSQVERLSEHTGEVRDLAFDPGGDTLYSAGKDQRLLQWDLGGHQRFIPRVSSGSDSAGAMVALPSPDGEVVVYFHPNAASAGGALRFLDVAAGTLGQPIVRNSASWTPSFSPKEFEEFATGDAEGFVRVWNWRTGALIVARRVNPAGIVSIQHARGGEEIVGLDRAMSIFRVDADTLEPIGEPILLAQDTAETGESPLDALNDSIAVSPDGRTAIAVLSAATSAWLDLSDGRVVHREPLGLEPARVRFSPDGRLLAVTANSGEVGLMQVASREWVRPPIAAHSGASWGATWAPDGSLFATSGADGRVILWDGQTGERLVTVPLGKPDSSTIATFLPDGHTLFVATNDYEVFTLDTRLETWVERACAIAGRNLTTEEWRQAFGDRPYHQTCAVE